ncbi:MAG: hypothetical protein ACLT4C_02950 [Butyricicoccus sp.]
MLLTGILIGPYVLNWLDDYICPSRPSCGRWRIILIKAGLSLDLSRPEKVGRIAVMMACYRS